MAHAIMIPSLVAAKNIDTLNRSFVCAVALDNGNVINLSGTPSVAGEGEVWTASTPTAATPTGLWMVGEPEVVLTNAQYKGLDPDPRNFFVAANTVATCFKIKKYDLIRLTADAFANSRTSENYVNVQASGKLAWASSSTAATLFQLIEVTNIPLSSGAPGSNRVTAYRLEAITE